MLSSKVAVIIPLHNSEKTVARSLESVLSQQTNFGFEIHCVINNCTDNTVSIVEKAFSAKTNNSVVKCHMAFCDIPGIVPALNCGLFSIGNDVEYVARQDGDDWWYPGKLQKQFEFLESNKDVSILGTQIRLVKPETFEYIATSNNPLFDEECREWFYSSRNPIAHPSVMFRRNILFRTGGYSDLLPVCEDYWMWLNASRYFNFANLDEVLVDYTSTHNPNYNPLAPQLASHIMNQINLCFPRK